jgi:hypothetical protein
MNNVQPNVSILRYPGNFSIEGNKLRITNKMGMSSVLFEDISSISFKSIQTPNWKYFLIGFLITILMTIIGGSTSNVSIVVLGLIIFIGFWIYSFINKNKWDNVIIETRGGLLLFYSVDNNEGINQVNKIEEEKRRITGLN